MKKKLILLHFLLFITFLIQAQNYTISGHITDAKNGETLISSSIYDVITRKGAVSNTYGFYSLTLPKGEVEVEYTYVGFGTQRRIFKLTKDTVINIKLIESIELKEVTVMGNRKEIGVKGSQMSAIEIPISMIKSVPTLFGEADIIKALQLLPGVKAGTEGSAGFYVRGGGPDENLFLLDGVPVYNVNHMGGFFSVFNPDAIKNVTLYKGSFPARFGGRLSSVLDIRMNDGNNKAIHGNVSVGIISSKFNVEGPLFSENTTFNISARRTYLDVLMQPIIKLAASYENSENQDVNLSAGYYFYDMNAKISHKFSDKDRLYLSAYMGDDAIYANMRQKYEDYENSTQESRFKLNWDWGNIITALRWNHIINNKLFMNATATYTRYRFNMDIGQINTETIKNPASKTDMSTTIGYRSGIQDFGPKVDFDYAPNPNHDIKFGASYTHHTFRPGVSVAQYKFENDTSIQKMDTTIGDQNVLSHETALYFEDNINIGSYVKANFGLHYSTFFVQDEFYNSLQPRIGLRVLLTDKLSLKAGYASMSQYIHLLSNNTISLPTDLWVPVTKRIEPMKSHQYSGGIFYNLLNIVDLTLEGYYKSMDNLIEYKDGASFLGSSTGWEDKVSMGRGWAYG
ncbi:MAG TPA: TonB-dependent receptor plug domain-containing protein, partial [Paludibacter sp.]|nr:TonB-dependent receptor plug domain-containing protein [Paludibacter sp.]